MKKCKNDKCDNNIVDSRTYCSQSCRSSWVNRNLKDYKKVSNTIIEKSAKNVSEYSENPKYCKYCNSKIEYKNRENKFCNHSCSAKFSNKNRIIKNRKLSDSGRKSILECNKRICQNRIDEYDKKYKICSICNGKIPYVIRKNKFCSNRCYSIYRRSNMVLTEYQLYRFMCKFKFNIYKYPEEFDLTLISKYGMYSAKNRGNNVNGISRDHKMSISYGFKNGILPYYISHPANCELLTQRNNSKKYMKNSITMEELISNVEKWNLKYGLMM